MRLVVTAPDGRIIPGYGVRAQGEAFELPDDLARQYVTDYPDDFAEEPASASGSVPEQEETEEDHVA
jgi:hypothetical protein